jgi:hypothetical protein
MVEQGARLSSQKAATSESTVHTAMMAIQLVDWKVVRGGQQYMLAYDHDEYTMW